MNKSISDYICRYITGLIDAQVLASELNKLAQNLVGSAPDENILILSQELNKVLAGIMLNKNNICTAHLYLN